MRHYQGGLIAALAMVTTAITHLFACASPNCVAVSTCETGSQGGDGLDPKGTPGRNPYGLPYPKDSLGWRVRSFTKPGLVLPNLVLEGAPPAPGAIGTVQMADLYDPEGRTHDAVALVLITRAIVVSRTVLDQFQASSSGRVAVLAILGEGEELRRPAKHADLLSWHEQYPWSWTALDPLFKDTSKLGFARMPVLAILDARTMEICSITEAIGNDAGPALEAEVAKIRSRGPSY